MSSPALKALAMALAAWKLAVEVKWAAMAGRQQAVAGKPALIPLGVAIPGAQAAYRARRR
jgi:hypothetical protein